MGKSIYSQINPARYRDKSVNQYHGRWRGEDISFNREFRGHIFTDEECAALCRGERIEVHNIRGSRGTYAVQGRLARVNLGLLSSVKFDVIDVVPNNPHYQYGMPLFNLTLSTRESRPTEKKYADEEDVVLNDDDIEGIYFGEPSDLLKSVDEYKQREKEAAEMAKAAAEAAIDDTYEEEDDEFAQITDDDFDTSLDFDDAIVQENTSYADGSSYLSENDDFQDSDYDDDIPDAYTPLDKNID